MLLTFDAAAAAAADAHAAGTAAAPAPKATATAQKTSARSRRTTSRRHARSVSSKSRSASRENPYELVLKSRAALVVDTDTGETVTMKNADEVMPIASLTKLMTALVVVDAQLPLEESLEIGPDDVDTERNTHSRLKVGTQLTREQMLLLALMSSENRAALALSTNYPGGRSAFLATMNAKAQALGMTATHFGDSAGLSNDSVSTARDLHRLVSAAYQQPLIRDYTTRPSAIVQLGRQKLTYRNSNRLVRASGDWNIELQKTGFTNEAGRCLVMHTTVLNRHLAMIFLNSSGTMTRYADALRVRRHVETEARRKPATVAEAATPS